MFGDVAYIPILGVRPAEMQALEETSSIVKAQMLPFVPLKPWATAKHIEQTLAKVNGAVGSHRLIADIDDHIMVNQRRPVHDSFDALLDPAAGHKNWVEFIAENELYVPSVLLIDPSTIAAQIDAFKAIGKGVVVRLHEQTFGAATGIAALFAGYANNSDVLFVLDFQKQNKDILLKSLSASLMCKSIRQILPDCFVSVSATTFPSDFVDVHEQEIFERKFYNEVVSQIGPDNVIYCDRASARAEAQTGGSGPPAPRVDYAGLEKWSFFREADEPDRDVAYQTAADRAVKHLGWADIGIWATEMIKNTAAGSNIGIYTAVACTAVRINHHMHIQTSGGGSLPAEIVWTD